MTGDRHTTALAALQSGVEKQADITSRVKEDTAAIRETGAAHTTALSALTSEAGMQFAFRENIISAQNSRNRRETLEWLSDLDFSKQQHSHISNYTEGTGLWLLTDLTFQQWKEGVFHNLLCLGMPGAGKTVMSAMVIRHLSRVSPSDTNVAVAFVYFKYDERRTQSKERIIEGLIKQLLSQAAGIPQSIDEASKKRDSPGFQPPYQDMLQAAVEKFEKVYLVIDALDEAEYSTGRDLISEIRLLPRSKVSLLVTSRPIPEVQAQFDGDKRMEIRASDEDITSYAKSRLAELPNSVNSSRDLQEKVVQAIVQSTQGMFLLAKLNMDSLKDKRRRSALIKALEDLPSGHNAYGDAYDNAMRRISNQSEDDQELARQVLTWVMYAKRPLTKTDLETALAVEVGQWTLDADNIVSAAELVSLCAGLVTVDESRSRKEAEAVRLVHYTTQEYFSRNEHHLLRNPNRVLSDVCITYLGLEDFAGEFSYKDPVNRFEPDWQITSHAVRYPFLRYAAQHWENHCEAALPFANDAEERHTLSLDLRLLTHPELMESYLRVGGEWVDAKVTKKQRHQIPRRFQFRRRTGIQYAAGRGKYQQVSALLNLGHNPNDEAYGTTPLIEAALGHHENVVRLLIDAKADADMALSVIILSHTKTSNDQTNGVQESYSISSQALESMVTLLLEAGADPNYTIQALRGMTALMCAAERGLERIVVKLCSVGADLDCKDDFYGATPLHWAVYNGHEGVVKQLLQYGCDPDIPAKHTKTPTYLALSKCNWTILEMLLDTGKIVLDRELYTRGSIFAFACGNESCPVSLLRRMAVSNRDILDTRLKCSHQTPLMCAAAARNADAMEMLLELGANVHLTDERGNTVLHILAGIGDDPQHVPAVMMRALLRAKMDVDARNKHGVTALMLASHTGAIKWVELLLEEGASVLMRNHNGWNPLKLATRGGHSDIVTRLLRFNTLPQIDRDIALMIASADGRCNIMRALIRAGASSNIAAEDQTTALMSAVKGGHLEAAKLLIEEGAAVDARKADGTSPLMLACSRGFKDVTRLLLDNGATVNLPNEQGETALVCLMRAKLKTHASDKALPDGAQEILPMLLRRGVDVNVLTMDGDTALSLATDPDYPHSDDARLLLEAGADPALTCRRREIAHLLLHTVRFMNSAVLQSMLNAGLDPNRGDRNGVTALMVASGDGEVDKVKILLSGRANVDAVDCRGETALIRACDAVFANPETVKELLNAGADTNHEANNGKTALFYLLKHIHGVRSITHEAEAVFNLLVGGGAALDSKAKDGDTLLMYAAREGDGETVQMLLAAGADPRGRDKDGRNTLMLASMLNKDCGAQAVEMLLDAGVNRHDHDFDGNTALMLAANCYSSTTTLRTLLNAGLDPCQRFATGMTTLMAVIASNDRWGVWEDSQGARAGILIKAGVSIDAADDKGDTALMYAARGTYQVTCALKTLLAAGANPNLTNKAGETALMKSVACRHEPLDKVNTLLEAGADVNAVDGQGRSVLHWAVESRHCRLGYVVEAILRAPGVILDQEDNTGETALACAERKRNAYGAKFIRDAIRRRDRT